jgi:hypothetical protein
MAFTKGAILVFLAIFFLPIDLVIFLGYLSTPATTA